MLKPLLEVVTYRLSPQDQKRINEYLPILGYRSVSEFTRCAVVSELERLDHSRKENENEPV